MREFGKAEEFYRVRILSVDDLGVEKLDWADDILYQKPKRENLSSKNIIQLQVVDVDNSNVLASLDFNSDVEAQEQLNTMTEDLSMLTKNEFDEKYLNA